MSTPPSSGVTSGKFPSGKDAFQGLAEPRAIAHLTGVTVVTRFKHHQASFLTRAALGHQTLVGLEVIEL